MLFDRASAKSILKRISYGLLIMGSLTERAEGKAPAEFDCAMRQLALDFTRRIQPFRPKHSLKAMVDTLNLHGGEPGGAAQCFNLTVPDNAPSVYQPSMPAAPPGTTSFYVDYDLGNDTTGEGTKALPFKSIKKALETTRTHRHSLESQKQQASYFIVLRAGIHYVNETIALGSTDSNVTFQSYKKEKVILSGARLASTLKKGPTWKRHANKPNVWVMDLSGSDIQEATGLRLSRARAVRARYPNGCTSDKPLPSGYKCVGYAKDGGVVEPSEGFGTNLLGTWIEADHPTMNQKDWYEYEDKNAPLRKESLLYDNFKLGVGGTCNNRFWPPAGFWCSAKCVGGAPHPPDCIVRFPKGISTSVLPNAPYQNPSTAVVHAWRPQHWASWMFEVSGEESNSTHLMFSKGGFQGGRGENLGEAFFVENVEEELDAENEFFFDAQKQHLLYYSRGKAPQGDVEIPTLKTIFRLSGTQEDPVTGFTLRGVHLRDTRLTFMDNHTMPSGGDWALNLRAAVEMCGVERAIIDSCTFADLDGNVLLIKGYARKVIIKKNDFHMIGGNIIAQLGETEAPGLPKEWGFGWNGTAGNQPRGTVVTENFAYRCGLFAKQSSFYFQGKSMENKITNNIFFHGPRAGINFNDGFGGGNLVEGNLLFATVMETGDHGPFNSWDRQTYAHKLNQNGEFVTKKDFDVIRRNFMVGNYYAQEVVDNDDGSAYFDTNHNFLVYGDVGLKSDFAGHTNYHSYNIYAYLNGPGFNTAGFQQPKGEEDKLHHSRIVLLSPEIGYTRYECNRCQKNGDSCPIVHDNMVYTSTGKTGNICGQDFADRVAAGLDPGSAVHKWPSPAEVIDWARALLFLFAEEPQVQAIS
mmetsp:Transcript_4887/g.8715  ORF Transcript_4887/g.8715 Transcript_4887/m.8715 type:complete len:863 (-) Transcript_4887:94-2682(-)